MAALGGVVFLATLLVQVGPAGAEPRPRTALLLEDGYRLEAVVSFPMALYHWLDSLVGTSGGKTTPAHRRQYQVAFGAPGAEDEELLWKFRGASEKHSDELRGIFLESVDLDAAVDRAGRRIGRKKTAGLRDALTHFRPRYERIWRDGEIPWSFVGRCRRDPARRELGDLLLRISRFYGVDPADSPRPTVVLLPVPGGYGTHAFYLNGHLVLEVRPGDRLADQASVIVHETSHFLFESLTSRRKARLRRIAVATGPNGRRAWRALQEALPTALGQGVADLAFRAGRWSETGRWYHTQEVDAYAKAIFELAAETLSEGGRFDETFVRKAIARYPSE